MAANLREKDLLVVGFWSDWDYLNSVLGAALVGVTPASVTVVDPFNTAQLQAKARDLWDVAHAAGVTFNHVRESGAEALDALRRAFSKNYLRQLFEAGREVVEAELGAPIDPAWADPPDVDSETLYGWRRDAEGVPSGRPATTKHPVNAQAAGAFHLLMRRAGAQHDGDGYLLNGQKVRVLNGAGSALALMQKLFLEAPTVPSADLVVAAGATDFGVPGNIIRAGRTGSVVRPSVGSRWVDVAGAREELNV
jgi:hypothetical protein